MATATAMARARRVAAAWCLAVVVLMAVSATAQVEVVEVDPGTAMPEDTATVSFDEPADGTWAYGDAVRVSVRPRHFRVPEDGIVCVSASWSLDEDGDADWTCYKQLSGKVLTTDVYGASNATSGLHRIAAMLVNHDRRPIGHPFGIHVYKPPTPTPVRPGEWLDLRKYMAGNMPKLTSEDESALTFYAPTLFWFMFRSFKFVTITRPLTGAVIDADEDDGFVDMDVAVSVAEPRFPESTMPQLCVTVDYVQHLCNGITDRFTVPALAPGQHVISAQLRARDGQYYGAPSTINVFVKLTDDARTARDLRAALPPPPHSLVTVHPDAISEDVAQYLLDAASKVGYEPISMVKELPGPSDVDGMCVLDRVEIVPLSVAALLELDLGDEYVDMRNAIHAIKEAAVQAAGLDCDIDECVEDVVELARYEKDDWHAQRYSHVRAQCERDYLRIPHQGRADPDVMKDVLLPDCVEEEATRAPRTHTVLVYLTTLPQGAGGSTYFPLVATTVQPVVGTAVVMNQCRPDAPTSDCVLDPRALYTSNVVEWHSATKVVATVYITA